MTQGTVCWRRRWRSRPQKKESPRRGSGTSSPQGRRFSPGTGSAGRDGPSPSGGGGATRGTRKGGPPAARRARGARPGAMGEGLRIKVNANVGSSRDRADVSLELAKMRVAVAAGADAVMDLSTGGPIDDIRRAILAECPVPVGTVPVYQASADAVTRGKSWVELTPADFFDGIVKQAEDGVDFMTVHCGVTREAITRLIREGRRLDIVRRGGSLLAGGVE